VPDRHVTCQEARAVQTRGAPEPSCGPWIRLPREKTTVRRKLGAVTLTRGGQVLKSS